MIVYNKITELTYNQFLILFLTEAVIILFTLLVLKKKLSFKLIIFSSIIAIVLSLLSIIIVNGFYGGMAYHERFGWPFQFQEMSRSIDDVSTPWGIRFDIWKFIANTIYWEIFPLLILFEILSKKRSKQFQLFVIGSLTLYALLTLFFSYINTQKEIEALIDPTQEITIVSTTST